VCAQVADGDRRSVFGEETAKNATGAMFPAVSPPTRSEREVEGCLRGLWAAELDEDLCCGVKQQRFVAGDEDLDLLLV